MSTKKQTLAQTSERLASMYEDVTVSVAAVHGDKAARAFEIVKLFSFARMHVMSGIMSLRAEGDAQDAVAETLDNSVLSLYSTTMTYIASEVGIPSAVMSELCKIAEQLALTSHREALRVIVSDKDTDRG